MCWADRARSKNHFVVLLVFSSVLLLMSPSAAYAAVGFTPSDYFAITELNTTIAFAYAGSYDSAILQNNFWSFSGLTLEGADSPQHIALSAQNCRVTIAHFDRIKWISEVGWLQYSVEGLGNQTFNYVDLVDGIVPTFRVFIDGVAKSENDGWTFGGGPMVRDVTLTVTGAASNVTIVYSGDYNATLASVPDFFPNQTSIPSHSISSEISSSLSPTPATGSPASTLPTPTPKTQQPSTSPFTAIIIVIFAAAIIVSVLVIIYRLYRRGQTT